MNIRADNSSILKVILIGAGTAVIIFALQASANIVNPILLALIIGISVDPLSVWLQRKGLPSGLALGLTIVIVLLSLIGLIILLILSLENLLTSLPQYSSTLQTSIQTMQESLNNAGLSGGIIQSAIEGIEPGPVISAATSFLNALLADLSNLFITLLVLFFFLVDLPLIKKILEKDLLATNPFLIRLRLMVRDLRQYVIISTQINFFVGVVSAIFLFIMGVDYAVLWGLLSFLLGYIPTLGFWISLIPPFILALLEFGIGKALIVLIGFNVINFVIQTFLQPKMMGSGLNLSASVVTISLFVWGWILGPTGALLAIPMTLIVKELFLDAYDDTRGLADLMSAAEPSKEKNAP